MIEILLEMIVYLFVEIIFEGIILGIVRLIRLIGIISLKFITLSNKPIQELSEKYMDSSKPYFLGFIISIGLIYLVIKLLN